MPKNETNGVITVKKLKSGSNGKQGENIAFGLKQFLKIEMNHMLKAEEMLNGFYPTLSKKISNEDLEEVFSDFQQQSFKHKERIEKILSRYQLKNPQHLNCEVINSHMQEYERIVKDFPEGATRDVILIVQLQKIIHHKIASYGSICEIADLLGYGRIADLLDRTLQECEEVDLLFSKIAEEVNADAFDETMQINS